MPVHKLALVNHAFADAVRTVNDRLPHFRFAINFIRWCASAENPRPSVIRLPPCSGPSATMALGALAALLPRLDSSLISLT